MPDLLVRVLTDNGYDLVHTGGRPKDEEPVTRFEARPIGSGRPGQWTGRARDDRESFIRGELA